MASETFYIMLTTDMENIKSVCKKIDAMMTSSIINDVYFLFPQISTTYR